MTKKIKIYSCYISNKSNEVNEIYKSNRMINEITIDIKDIQVLIKEQNTNLYTIYLKNSDFFLHSIKFNGQDGNTMKILENFEKY